MLCQAELTHDFVHRKMSCVKREANMLISMLSSMYWWRHLHLHLRLTSASRMLWWNLRNSLCR